VAVRRLGFIRAMNELKWHGKERKGNARFLNPAYIISVPVMAALCTICHVTYEYMMSVKVKLDGPVTGLNR
jgi:hypothetical protein